MAQQQTTTHLRRLAGRRPISSGSTAAGSPLPGGPHLPLPANDFPPVLFRLPQVILEAKPDLVSPETSDKPRENRSASPFPLSVALQKNQNQSESEQRNQSAEAGRNVFNHVAGAVTGAVAGTVASGVAAAGTLAGSALSATSFGSTPSIGNAPGTRQAFSSAAANLDSSSDSQTTFAARATSANAIPIASASHTASRPIPAPAQADARSWWEHWSSGIILMLLILALVTAGVMAIRDPERSRSTQRPIADEIETKEKEASNVPPQSPAKEEKKSTLADSNASVAPTPSPTATEASATLKPSATLSPSLLPESTSSTSNASTSSKVPSFTLGPSTQNSNNASSRIPGSEPTMVANSSGFTSSAQPSPSAAASQGSPSLFANSDNSNATPAISASTQIGKPQSESFDATIPANPSSGSVPAEDVKPNLTWPVEETPATSPSSKSQSATTSSDTLKLSQNPAVTTPSLPLAADTQTPAANTTSTATSTPVISAAPPRAAYLETSLPNEDLESILEMRRQAMANSRLVSNQYYPSTTPSQAVGTRSWTYNPSPNTVPNANPNAAPYANPASMPAANPNVHSWTLPQASNPQAMPGQAIYGASSGQPPRNSMPPPQNGLNIDPEYARQLGYGQPSSSPQTNISGNSQSQVGWWNNNAAAQARNIAAPSGSMMVPAPGYMIPNNPGLPNNQQQPAYDYSNRNMPAGYPAGTVR